MERDIDMSCGGEAFASEKREGEEVESSEHSTSISMSKWDTSLFHCSASFRIAFSFCATSLHVSFARGLECNSFKLISFKIELKYLNLFVHIINNYLVLLENRDESFGTEMRIPINATTFNQKVLWILL